MTVTPDELKHGLGAFTSLALALENKLWNLSDDEAALNGVAVLFADIDPAALPIAMMLPVAEFVFNWLVEHNTQGQKDSQTPMTGGPPRSRISPP